MTGKKQGIRVFQVVLTRCIYKEEWEIIVPGRFFYWVGGNLMRGCFHHSNLFKAKKVFCKYWTSRSRGMGNYRSGRFFYWVGGNLMRGCFRHSNLFKAKKIFCKYWTSIKIKIRMTCVYREYKVKIKKMAQYKQWIQLKKILT